MSLNNCIIFNNVRLSFPCIASPQIHQDTQKASYGADLIIDPADPNFAKFMAIVHKLAVEKWGEKAQAVVAMCEQDKRSRCYGKGEEKIHQTKMVPYEGYPGNLYITARGSRMPQIIRPDGSPVEEANLIERQAVARTLYGGCRADVVVKPWMQNNTPDKGGRAVRCDLVAIRFAGDDAPFGGGVTDASALFTVPAAPAAAPWGLATPTPAAAPKAPWG